MTFSHVFFSLDYENPVAFSVDKPKYGLGGGAKLFQHPVYVMIFWILDHFSQKIKSCTQKSEKVLFLHLFPSLTIFSKMFFHRCYSNHATYIIQKYFNV